MVVLVQALFDIVGAIHKSPVQLLVYSLWVRFMAAGAYLILIEFYVVDKCR